MSIKRKNIVLFPFFFLFLYLFTSCDKSRVYEEWHDVKGNLWNKDSSACFSFDIEDSLATYNINFGLRHTNLYPYENIWLLTNLETEDSSISYSDTIQLVLANKEGVWYGERSARIYTYVVPLYRGIRFPLPGKYSFRIKHGMREDELLGVTSVGLRVETVEVLE